MWPLCVVTMSEVTKNMAIKYVVAVVMVTVMWSLRMWSL